MGANFEMKFDDKQLVECIEKIGSGIKPFIRPAAQTGIQVLYDEVKLRCPEGVDGHYFYGTSYKKTGQRYYFEAGNLKRSIYQVFSKSKSSDLKSEYQVSWNHTKAPYGFMVENGTSRWPAGHPFLRPSYDAVNREAMEKARDKLFAGVRTVLPEVM